MTFPEQIRKMIRLLAKQYEIKDVIIERINFEETGYCAEKWIIKYNTIHRLTSDFIYEIIIK
jgi:hypothetical protein